MMDDENAAGYKKIQIKPYIGGSLTSANVTHKSYYGLIKSSWEIKDKNLFMHIEIPVNTQAIIYLPSSNEKAITEGNKSIMSSHDFKIIGKEGGKYTVVEAGSGTYQFKMPN